MGERAQPQPLSRRRFLGHAGVIGAGIAAGGALSACGNAMAPAASGPDAAIESQLVPFYGRRQAGIVTPVQERLVFAAFDVLTPSRAELTATLKTWTGAAAAMARGELIPGVTDPQAPAPDSGEAAGLAPGNLTLTIGFGPSLFDSRFGLASSKPAALAALPPLPLEQLDPAYVGGDISVQACSDDPQIAFHAVRNLARIASGAVSLRWIEFGFGKTSRTSPTQATPRNLMGFKDGTRNISSSQTDLLDRYVWTADGSGPAWFRGGTYQVVRRMRMFIEAWDENDLADQQRVFGRYKLSGAPLSGEQEFDTPSFAAVDEVDRLLIPANAHIRLLAPEQNDGMHLLRRGYSFSDGVDPESGLLDAGLLFIAYMRDPQQFVTLAGKMGNDALGEYVRVVGSGLFAVPGGIQEGQSWGQGLFE
ncbi:MAG: deferrochelatase/peroxidase EfeB [Candidatus Dormibacteraeota bacterium]|nr:deferrochelatase/peroxidase EfeB [Candidatus Dormibacteraeota bacterium]